MPPAVSDHKGNWKLVRIFHGSDNGEHRYKLFNLKDDIGKQNNLAGKFPDRVEQLDTLIEQHLVDTQAVRPLPNPEFDPSMHDVTQERQAKLKGNARTQKKHRAKPAGKPVAGWHPGSTCTLSVSKSGLLVNSTGNDPYLSHRLPQAIDETAFTLHITMISDSSGKGQVFWQETAAGPFKADRSQFFDIQHDDEKHEYTVEFTTWSLLLAVRIDPSRGQGKIEISDIRLVGKDGATHYRLKLPAAPTASTRREPKPNVSEPRALSSKQSPEDTVPFRNHQEQGFKAGRNHAKSALNIHSRRLQILDCCMPRCATRRV